MASKSEVGHNKNVANFKALCLIAEEMGTLYNPANTTITLTAMEPVREQLDTTMTTLGQETALLKNALAGRETEIKPLSKKTTQSLNAFRSFPVSDAEKEHLLSLARKVRGDKNRAPKDPEKTDTDTISTSQQSYDNRIANFGNYVAQLKTHTIYAPNEADMKVDALTAYHTSLNDWNNSAKTHTYAVLTVRTDRDQKLYDGNTNVMDMQRDIKSYLLSLGVPGKPYYQAAIKLKFRDK